MSKDFVTTLMALSGSMMLAGGFFGSTLSGLVVTRVGRKFSLLIMNYLNIVATVFMSVATYRLYSYECFIVGRLIFGVFCGFGMSESWFRTRVRGVFAREICGVTRAKRSAFLTPWPQKARKL